MRPRLLSARVKLLSRPKYWELRTRWLQWSANMAALFVRSKQTVRRMTQVTRIITSSILYAIFALLAAGGSVAVTQLLGQKLRGSVQTWSWMPGPLEAVAVWLGSTPSTSGQYLDLVAATLAVTGTLASVYFATVAFVISTTYRDATSRVRSLVTRLPSGRAYASVYVFAVLYGVVILVLPLTGREPSILTLLTLASLLALVATSFGRLRTQLYGLLEPAKLMPAIEQELTRWLNYAIRSSNSSQKQRVAISRGRALESLNTLRDLGILVRAREQQTFRNESKYAAVDPRAVKVVHALSSIWWGYATKKQKLNGLREWGVLRERHKDWLTASTFEVDAALNTSTTLQADKQTDKVWFERHISSVMAAHLANRTPAQLDDLVGRLDMLPRHLASRGQFEEIQLWSDVVVATTMDAVRNTTSESTAVSDKASSSNQVTLARDHNLIDFSILSYAQATLGLSDYLSAMRNGFPGWVDRQAQGEDVRQLGPVALALFQDLKDSLAFELHTEGRRVTSRANIYQLAARAIASEAVDQIDFVIDGIESTLLPWVLRISATTDLPAAAALSRMDELLHKMSATLIPSAEALFGACESVHQDVDDKWPDLSMTSQQGKVHEMMRQMRLPIARIATGVDLELDPDRPDAFGWAFHRAHDDLFLDVLADEKPVDLPQRLRCLAAATDRATQRLRSTVKRTHISVALSYQSEPLLLLLQISGIAYAQGRFNGRGVLFESFSDVWSGFLEDDPQEVIGYVLSVIGVDEETVPFAPGDLRRFSRSQRARSHFHFLRDKDTAELFEYGEDRRQGKIMDATSVEIANHLHLHGSFEHVFVAAWLLPEALARGASVQPGELAGPRFWEFYGRITSVMQGDSDDPAQGEGLGGASE